NERPAEAEPLVATRMKNGTGKALAADLIAASFGNIVFTPDPVASSLVASAKSAASLGLPGAQALTGTDMKRLYDLRLLNKVLKARGKAAISTSARPEPR